MNAQVRDQPRSAFSRAGTGDGHHALFSGNSDGPEHTAPEQFGAPEEDIAVLELVRENAQKTGEAACHLPPEFKLRLPPVAHFSIGPEEQRAHPVGLPSERIPTPDQLPETREEDQPEEVRKDEGE